MKFTRALQSACVGNKTPVLAEYNNGGKAKRAELFDLFMNSGMNLQACADVLMVQHSV